MSELQAIKERMDTVTHLEWITGDIRVEDVYWLIEQAEKVEKMNDNHALDHIVNDLRKQNRNLKQGIVDILMQYPKLGTQEVADKLRELLLTN